MDALTHTMLFQSSGRAAAVAETAALLAQAATLCADDAAPLHEIDLNTAQALMLDAERERAPRQQGLQEFVFPRLHTCLLIRPLKLTITASWTTHLVRSSARRTTSMRSFPPRHCPGPGLASRISLASCTSPRTHFQFLDMSFI